MRVNISPLDLWEKISQVKERAVTEDLRNRCKVYLEELYLGKVESAKRFIEEIDKKDDFLKHFTSDMRDKKFVKTLRKREINDNLEVLKALYSYGTHLVIEAQKTGMDVKNYLLFINEEISRLLNGGKISESFVEKFA